MLCRVRRLAGASCPIGCPERPQTLPGAAQRAYSRHDGTPAWEALEEIVGGLEGGSSVRSRQGWAGVAAVFEQPPAGANVALPGDRYQGVAGPATAEQSRGRGNVCRIAVADTAP
jgi:cystathionine gamma-synthase